MTQFFRKIKIDTNDTLYSKIIRFGKTRCEMCRCVKPLQCSHIMGRGRHATRFLIKPKPNSIALCVDCHGWFDTHKIWQLIYDERKRVFNWKEESYTFLVEKLGYTWDELQKIHIKASGTSHYGPIEKRQKNIELKEAYSELLEKANYRR